MTQSTIALQLGNIAIRQHNGLYSLNDLHKASGNAAKHRPNYFLGLEQTKELVAEIEIAGNPAIEAKTKVGTYACKELVIAYAAWISAAFHLKVIRVFLESVQHAALPPATLTPAQQQQLKAAIEAKCKGDARAYSQCYRALYEAFHIPSYKDVPASQFDAALAFVADWHYTPAHDLVERNSYETLNQLVDRLARQLADPNGYSVITFMPLYEVICQKLGHGQRYIERLPEFIADPSFDVEPQLLSRLNQATHQRLMQKLTDAYEGVDVLSTAIKRIKGKPTPPALPN